VNAGARARRKVSMQAKSSQRAKLGRVVSFLMGHERHHRRTAMRSWLRARVSFMSTASAHTAHAQRLGVSALFQEIQLCLVMYDQAHRGVHLSVGRAC
jgi:hypothetical protein